MLSRIWLAGLWWLRNRQQSASEEDLQRRLADADKQIRDLQYDIERLRNQLAISQEDVKGLTALNIRNQTRIEAETAEAAQRIAMASMPEERRRLGA